VSSSRSGIVPHIYRVDIIWDESPALEGRVGYYDALERLRTCCGTMCCSSYV
jgi:hypothetical protein